MEKGLHEGILDSMEYLDFFVDGPAIWGMYGFYLGLPPFSICD